MKYLFIEAHLDDNILACGGTISRLKEQGHHITCITLSHIYGGIDLTDEWIKAMELLNVDSFDKRNFDTRFFNAQYDNILQYLFQVQKQNYDFIFTHSATCVHSDHSTVGKACVRVFKHDNLITYQHPWNTRELKQNYFVKLLEKHISKKTTALECYKSQSKRTYFEEDFIYAEVKRTGIICNSEYAEGFYAVNLIV